MLIPAKICSAFPLLNFSGLDLAALTNAAVGQKKGFFFPLFAEFPGFSMCFLFIIEVLLNIHVKMKSGKSNHSSSSL